MKKNLLSILILALLIVNIILNVIVMVSVTSTNKKTASVVGSIASILDLEIDKGEDGEQEQIAMEDTAIYDIADKLTVPLKMVGQEEGGDGEQHFLVVSVSLAMNSKDKDYKTYGSAESMTEKEGMIKGEITDVISGYTLSEIQRDSDAVREEILDRLQTMFGSEFIYKVTFRDFIPQ